MTQPSRRSLLIATGFAATGLAATALATNALAPSRARAAEPADPRMSERALGPAHAKAVVEEWFSLTCTHCARFALTVFPEVKARLIDTGKLRYVFRDYPLDQVALMAAMVARALPPDRYEPFVLTLFATQSRWAFGQADQKEELARMAALAGMPREVFDRTVNDDALRAAITGEAAWGEQKYNINSTPTFVCGTRTKSGEMEYGEFVKFVGL